MILDYDDYYENIDANQKIVEDYMYDDSYSDDDSDIIENDYLFLVPETSWFEHLIEIMLISVFIIGFTFII